MKKIILFYIIILSAGSCFAQQVTFQKTIGGTGEDQGYSVQQTADGGYIILGKTNSFGAGDYDVYLVKTDSFGNILWTKTYGGTDEDAGTSVQQTADGGYIIAGGAGSGDVYLIKTDVNGDTLWTKTYGGVNGDYGNSVQQTTDGGYIITGQTNSFGAGNYDIYLIKTNSNGALLWTKTFGGPGTNIYSDYAGVVKQTTDGGYIIGGSTAGSFGAGDYDSYLIKTDSLGNTLWTKTYGGTDTETGFCIQQTMDGGYIFTGSTRSFGAGQLDVYLVKTDSSGDTLWTKAFGGIYFENGNWIQQTLDGGYIIAGSTNSFGAGFYDFYLIKTDSIGDALWTKTFGGASAEGARCTQQTTDGGYIITGNYNYFTAPFDIYLIKTDSLGNSGCNEGNTTTIASSTATQITIPPTQVSSGGTIYHSPTIESSGGTVTTLCTTVGIPSANPNPQSAITISPNPTTNNFTITFPNTVHKGSVEIYNVIGKIIFKSPLTPKGETKVEVPLGDLGAGIYCVKVRGEEIEYCGKLVIEN